jgi:hypothetical protein
MVLGELSGDAEGNADGEELGRMDGTLLGKAVGSKDGFLLGLLDGKKVGAPLKIKLNYSSLRKREKCGNNSRKDDIFAFHT